MEKIYEHRIAEGDHAESISVEAEAIDESVRISISDVMDIDSENENEQITSITLSQDRIMPLVDALLSSINANNHVALSFSNEQIKTAIEAIELSVVVLENEANKGNVPLFIINNLQSRYSALLEEIKLYAPIGGA